MGGLISMKDSKIRILKSLTKKGGDAGFKSLTVNRDIGPLKFRTIWGLGLQIHVLECFSHQRRLTFCLPTSSWHFLVKRSFSSWNHRGSNLCVSTMCQQCQAAERRERIFERRPRIKEPFCLEYTRAHVYTAAA